jgi:hypothetical protein
VIGFEWKDDLNLLNIALELYSYSVDELALFDVEKLYRILSDELLVLENED